MKHPNRIRIAALGLAFFALLAMWIFRPKQFPAEITAARPATAELLGPPTADSSLTFSSPSSERKIYPYSIIPGGIASIESLKNTIEHNPDIALHLKDFNLQNAKFVEVTEPRSVYVSYRIGSKILWMTRRLTLAKGESLVTDGTRTLRGRCGNDVSDVPRQPTSAAEPAVTELETPLAMPRTHLPLDVDPLPLLAYSPPESSFVGGPSILPVPPAEAPPDSNSSAPPTFPSPPFIVPPFGPPGSYAPIPPVPPISTPEPSALLLAFLGVMGVGTRRMWKKRK